MTVVNCPVDHHSATDLSGEPAYDVWFVALARDDIRQMSVDQMDAALEAGVISLETRVWREGMRDWSRLRRVAGLEEGELRSSPSTEFRRTAQTPCSPTPVAVQAEPPQWATIPRVLVGEWEEAPAPRGNRSRAAFCVIAAVTVAVGGVVFVNRGFWLGHWRSRLDAVLAGKGAAAPALAVEPTRTVERLAVEPREAAAKRPHRGNEPTGAEASQAGHEPERVSIPTLRFDGNDLVPNAPRTDGPDATESLVQDAKTVREGERQVGAEQAPPNPVRSRRGSRSGKFRRESKEGQSARAKLIRAPRPTAKEAASEKAESEAENVDSTFDPLNAELP